MENNSNASMSDKDKDMSESFEFATDKSEDSTEKANKKKKKVPKRSLFLPAQDTEQAKPKAEVDRPWVDLQKDKLLSGTLLERALQIESGEDSKEEDAEADSEADPDSEAEPAKLVEEFKEEVADSAAAIEAEIAISDEPEAAEGAADFVEAVEENVDSGMVPSQAIESAQEQTIERVERASVPDDVAEVPLQVDALLTELPLVEQAPKRPKEQAEVAKDIVDIAESSQSDDESQPQVVSQQRAAQQSKAVPARARSHRSVANGSSGGGPQPPSGPPLGPSSSPNSLPPAGGGAGPNVITMAQAAPNILSQAALNSDPSVNKMNDMYYRRKNTGKVVLAGVLGYAFGRRRGRIKTENRLEPEVRQRDAEIVELKTKLDTSEQRVRSKTSEAKALREKVPEQPQQTEALQVPPVKQETARPVEPLVSEEKPVVAAPEVTSPEVPVVEQAAQPRAAELAEIQQQQEAYAEQLVSESQPTAEVSISLPDSPYRSAYGSTRTERIESPVAQQITERLNVTEGPVVERAQPVPERPKLDLDTQAMTMPELLEIADTIDTGSGSLKQMYEQRRIDSVNMRKAIAEHAAGRNIDDLVHKSLEAEEMQRELRNEVKTDSSGDPRQASSGGLGAGGGAAIQAATQGSGQDEDDTLESDAVVRQYEDSVAARRIQGQDGQRSGVFERRITDMNPIIASSIGIAGGALIAGLLLFLFA